MAFCSSAISVQRCNYLLVFAIGSCMFFLMPPGVVTASGSSDVKHLFRLAQYACIFIAFAIFIAKKRHSAFSTLVLLYAGFGLVSAIHGGGPILGGVRSMLPTVAAVLIAYSLAEDHRRELLWGVLWVCSTLLVLNIAVMLIYPIGTPFLWEETNVTFLGNRNSFGRYYLAALFASSLLDYSRNRFVSPRTVIILALSVFQLLLSFSSTTFVELAFAVAGYVLVRSKKVRKLLTASTYAVIYFVFFFLFVVFRVQGLFGFVIEGVFGKRLDFSGRTEIWDDAVAAMDGDHLLLGYYKGHSTPLGLVLGKPCWTAHNAILDLLVWGGVISLILFLTFVGIVCWKLYKTRETQLSAMYSLCLGANFIGGLMESIMFPYFGFYLGLAYADPLLLASAEGGGRRRQQARIGKYEK